MKYEKYQTHNKLDWIISIPNTWEISRIKNLFNLRDERNHLPLNEVNLLSLYTKIGVAQNSDIEYRTGNRAVNADNYKLVYADDIVVNIILCWMGAIGRSNYNGVTSPAYDVYAPRSNVFSKYYHYLFRLPHFSGECYKRGHGIMAMRWRTYSPEFQNIVVPVPSFDEQVHIVRYLDWQVSKINALIAAKKHEIKLLVEERQVLIDIFVLRSLHDRETKVSSLSWGISIPSTWNAYKFNQVFDFGKGLAITKANLLPSGTPVISYGQVHSKTNTGTSIDDSLIRFVSEDYIQSAPNSLVHEGDFIFADTSEDYQGVGNCVYVDRDDTLFAGYHTVIARPKDNKARRYLAYLFLSSAWRYSLRKQVNGVKVYSITQRILKNTCVILPPEDEQEEIVALLDAQCSRIGALKQRIHEEIECFHELRTRLISDVVTGQIDVRGIEVPNFDMVEETDSDEENLDDEDAAEETEEQEE